MDNISGGKKRVVDAMALSLLPRPAYCCCWCAIRLWMRLITTQMNAILPSGWHIERLGMIIRGEGC